MIYIETEDLYHVSSDNIKDVQRHKIKSYESKYGWIHLYCYIHVSL